MRCFSLLLLLAAAVRAQDAIPADAPTADAPMELLEFDPPLSQFRLQEARDAPTTLRVRLHQRPRALATLYFESANLKFSACALQIRPESYNQWHTIDVRGLPYFTDADRARTEVISMRMSCPHGGADWHGRRWSYPVERPAGVKGATCVASGDPHFTSFDGRTYDFQGIGCFYLVKAPSLTVQTITDVWNNGASVSVATAIRYGPAHFIVDARETNAANRMVRLSGDTAGVDITVSTNNEEFRFRFPDGSSVTVTYHGGNPRAYLNHQIDIPGCHKGRTLGLCGTYDGDPANDWTAQNGDVSPNVNDFGNSWRVPATDDIFVCKHECPDALAARNTIRPCDQCKIPETLAGPGVFVDQSEGYHPWHGPQGTYTRAKPDYSRLPKVLVARPPNNPDLEARATQACNDAFSGLADAHAILRPDPYIRSCIADCRLTGSLEMVDAAKTSYMNRVYTNVRPVLNLVQMAPARRSGYANSPEAKACQNAAQVLGLGSSRCPNNCSGHGICLKRGCVCRPGFTGVACARRLSAYGMPIVNSGRANTIRHIDDHDVYPRVRDDFFNAPPRRPQVHAGFTPAPHSPFHNGFTQATHRPAVAPFEDDHQFDDEEVDFSQEEQ